MPGSAVWPTLLATMRTTMRTTMTTRTTTLAAGPLVARTMPSGGFVACHTVTPRLVKLVARRTAAFVCCPDVEICVVVGDRVEVSNWLGARLCFFFGD
ncbi:hypothetical protein DFJ73DRAFT_852636 [Zopfochytrium polystomum]|nr:hypothetical protein DFJ73DRAFT_852636 [Zopfochytrium polystomum]